MKKALLILLIFSLVASGQKALAESIKLEVPIVVTNIIINEETGKEERVSSDDAEQENDEMDSVKDDDIDAGWEGQEGDANVLTAGLRFQNITIPQGATIDSAYFILCSHQIKAATDVAKITIYGEAADNPETFSIDELITSRPTTNASVLWTVAEEWGLWTYHNSADISAVVQELVNRPGWESGNAMAFILAGEDQGPSFDDNAREFEAFENLADPDDGGDGQNHPERVPRLVIYFSVEQGTLETQIQITDVIFNEEDGKEQPISSDDAEQENDEMDSVKDDDIDAGWEGQEGDANVLTAGLRFRNIAIPQGATIEEAYIEVCSHQMKTAADVAKITIYGEAADNPETFNIDELITSRPYTNASVAWTVAEEWGLWTYHKTADISSIVQELVNRQGWKSGNAMAFILAGEDQGPSFDDNAREFEAYENLADPDDGGDGQNHPDRRPKFVVKYRTSVGSVFEDSNIKTLKVYPNPNAGEMNIDFETIDETQVQIFDESGAIVKTLEFGFSDRISVDASALSTGAYVVKAVHGDEIYVQKVIVE